jgi:hypothetical protein
LVGVELLNLTQVYKLLDYKFERLT